MKYNLDRDLKKIRLAAWLPTDNGKSDTTEPFIYHQKPFFAHDMVFQDVACKLVYVIQFHFLC